MSLPVRVSCVSYLNSKPFMYGLTHHDVLNKMHLFTDNPADCAMKLISGDADIGLVPIAAIPLINNANIISEYCISAEGDVKSVLLLSNVPLPEIENIILDYQSMTSVNLVKILAENFWKIAPSFTEALPGFENTITGKNAAVVIGDRALKLRDNFKYSYDLSGEWNRFTGLPFVFACWVSNKEIDPDFINSFNEALGIGINNIDAVIEELKLSGKYFEGVESYLKTNLNYTLDNSKKEAMELFLTYIKKMQPVALKD